MFQKKYVERHDSTVVHAAPNPPEDEAPLGAFPLNPHTNSAAVHNESVGLLGRTAPYLDLASIRGKAEVATFMLMCYGLLTLVIE